jgi:hypothetical protein
MPIYGFLGNYVKAVTGFSNRIPYFFVDVSLNVIRKQDNHV